MAKKLKAKQRQTNALLTSLPAPVKSPYTPKAPYSEGPGRRDRLQNDYGNVYAQVAAKNLGNLGTTNAPNTSGGGVPSGAPALSPITQEYNSNRGAVDAAYANNAAQLAQLQAQYAQSAGQVGQQITGDYNAARGIVGEQGAGLGADLAAQGAGSPAVDAELRLRQSALADANANQQALLAQNNGLQAADFAQRQAASGAAQAASQSELLAAYQAAQAAGVGGGGGGGGRGRGGGGGGYGSSSGGPGGRMTASDFNYVQDVANQTFGESNRLKNVRQAQHDFLAGQSYGKNQPYLRAALQDLRSNYRNGVGNPQSLLAKVGKNKTATREMILNYIKATNQARNKRAYAGKNQVASTAKRLGYGG